MVGVEEEEDEAAGAPRGIDSPSSFVGDGGGGTHEDDDDDDYDSGNAPRKGGERDEEEEDDDNDEEEDERTQTQCTFQEKKEGKNTRLSRSRSTRSERVRSTRDECTARPTPMRLGSRTTTRRREGGIGTCLPGRRLKERANVSRQRFEK